VSLSRERQSPDWRLPAEVGLPAVGRVANPSAGNWPARNGTARVSSSGKPNPSNPEESGTPHGSRELSSELVVWYYGPGRHADGENIETKGFATRLPPGYGIPFSIMRGESPRGWDTELYGQTNEKDSRGPRSPFGALLDFTRVAT
jgi:hypothetical protein